MVRRSKYHKERNAFLHLLAFFKRYPEYIHHLDSDRNAVEMWEVIFFHFFGVNPQDPQNGVDYSRFRPGSNDPRWDVLFFEYKALRLYQSLTSDCVSNT